MTQISFATFPCKSNRAVAFAPAVFDFTFSLSQKQTFSEYIFVLYFELKNLPCGNTNGRKQKFHNVFQRTLEDTNIGLFLSHCLEYIFLRFHISRNHRIHNIGLGNLPHICKYLLSSCILLH